MDPEQFTYHLVITKKLILESSVDWPIFSKKIYQRLYGTIMQILYKTGNSVVEVIIIYADRNIYLLFGVSKTSNISKEEWEGV